MKALLILALVIGSTVVSAKDCSKIIEKEITKDYPYNVETMTMEIKRVGSVNIGHRFVDNRWTPRFDIYTAGTSDEGGGIMYYAIVEAKDCTIVKLNDFHQQDD